MIKFKILLILACLLIPQTVFAELSVINKWRIEQAIFRCEKTNNDLVYDGYWENVLTADNQQTLCIAEQFAILVASDGETLIESNGLNLINNCREKSKKDKRKYYTCLKTQLTKATKTLSEPCQELAAEKLWEGKNCQNMVSYIFMTKFQVFMEENRPLYEKAIAGIENLENRKWVTILFNPITAIVFFVLYVLHFVFFIEPGNWMKISKFGFFLGPLILLAFYLQGGVRYLIAGIVILIVAVVMIVNHRRYFIKRKKMFL